MILSEPSCIRPQFEGKSFRRFALVSLTPSTEQANSDHESQSVDDSTLHSLKLHYKITKSGSSKILCIFASSLYQLIDDIRLSFKSQRDLLFILKRVFSLLDGYITLTRGESVVTLNILLKFVFTASCEEDIDKKRALLNRHNYGTLLLCSMMLTLKLLRDNAPSNGWWCDIFNVPLHTMVQSEKALLKLTDFRLFPNADLFVFLSRIIAK
ncbi:hypothetical protein BLNAU_9572 [Blattamonas nauphoetae]|uniref:Uncharacterized protein n=1 Tax=Blattamonas nauphoetae TaxID=2049346 RepID=A0ABQ9XVM4_9EUKA|nr:hypothetical protein BLNAU_9572 [Blattamonas nauphoetae]